MLLPSLHRRATEAQRLWLGPMSSKPGPPRSPHSCFSGRPLKTKAPPQPPGHLAASAQTPRLLETPEHRQAGEGVRSVAS